MLLLTLVRTDLLDNWRDSLPEGTPNYFLINIQSKDIPELKTFLQNDGRTTAALYPMVKARLTAINGRPVEPGSYVDDEARRWANRDYNLSWAAALPEANRLVEGKWWPDRSTEQKLFSISDEMQKALDLKPGDTLTYLIAGSEVTGTIANIRQVDWDSFNANFFVLANPGTLAGHPASYITSFYLPGESKRLIIDLVRRFPSITVFDLDALITQVRKIMEQVIQTVEFVFGFTLLAGIIVLIAALQTTHDERRYESALLSTIGANKRQILSGLTAEFLCTGLIAGILSAFSATAIELILAKSVFDMDVTVNYRLWVIAPLLCTVIIVLGGLAGTRHVLYTPPMVALREN